MIIGVVNRLDVAVRRAVLTGISQVTGKISEHNAAELETDIVEVTAHAGARPDHAEWQGGWYSLSGKSKKYRSLAEATGYGRVDGLKGANCRHDFFPVIEGVDVPLYTKEELANIDPPPFEYNGKRYTYYEATQKQRSMERAIRKTKREILAADKSGDKDRFTEKSIRLRRQREEYDKFSKSAGLLTQNERNQVVGFGRSEASRASWAARSVQTSGNGPKGTPPSGSSGSTSSQDSPFQASISQNNTTGKTNQIVVDKPAVTSGGNEMFRGLTNGGKNGKMNQSYKMSADKGFTLNGKDYSVTTDKEAVEKAHKFAKENLKAGIVDFSKLENADVISPLLKRLEELEIKHGKYFFQIYVVDYMEDLDFALVTPDCSLHLNAKYMNSVEATNDFLERMKNKKLLPTKHNDTEFIITHEFMHFISRDEIDNKRSGVYKYIPDEKGRNQTLASRNSKKNEAEYAADAMAMVEYGEINHPVWKKIYNYFLGDE